MRISLARCVPALLAVVTLSASLHAQDMPMPPGTGHDMMHMDMPMPDAGNPLGLEHTRDGSGTSWLPDVSPMTGPMWQRGTWTLMAHGSAFLTAIHADGPRGDTHAGSLNWIMGMAQRPAGRGQLQLRAMMSAEPLTVGRCGYPTLLASGEACRGQALHDQQHPHDLFMELAVQYRRALGPGVALELYGGPAGEPALGPVAFPHRLSAMPNPIAPVAHHWLDSTHVTFGVLTAGLYGRWWKTEVSAFNGREPDDRRYDIETGALDSYAGRLTLMPARAWAVQVSAGHVTPADADHGAHAATDRITASATYHEVVNNRTWATTMAWGQNREHGHASSAWLLESARDLTTRDVLYGRGEVVRKTAGDLSLPLEPESSFMVGKLQVGYTRWVGAWHGLRAGIGGSLGVSFVPASLEPFYGGRRAGEASLYVTVRPR